MNLEEKFSYFHFFITLPREIALQKFVGEFNDLGTLEGKLDPSIPLSHSVCFKCYRKFDDWDDWVRKDYFIQHQKYFFEPE